ncbi:unnamed protein product [Meganyctiphanes norvegica]|uniref:Uncharacterized protein n=1 Tax=Meganyctiphanes norvegica TaxID=48144 RepID=A0AAV2SX48_MEGNR
MTRLSQHQHNHKQHHDTPRNNTEENTRNFSWGKIFSHELLTCSDGELIDQLQSENEHIILARRINRTRDGDTVPTRLIKIKCDMPTHPTHILCLHESYSVGTFIPPPKKCSKCKQYGHWVSDSGGCRRNWRCDRCGGSHDSGHSCEAELHCSSCNQAGHGSNDRDCPKYLKKRDCRIKLRKKCFIPQC